MDLLIRNIGQLVTCKGFKAKKGVKAMNELFIIQGPAAVVVKDGKILFAGKEADLKPEMYVAYPEFDAKGQCLMPGFVDSHTHLVFGGFREDEFQWRLAGDSYMSIMERGGGINSTMKATRIASHKELADAARIHLKSMLHQGITTAEAKSGYGMDLETEIRLLEVIRELDRTQPIDLYPTFMGAHSTPPEYKGNEDGFIQFLCKEVLPVVKEKDLSNCCDIFTEKNVFDHEQTRRMLGAAKELGMDVKMHADEIVPFGGAELAAELGCLSADHLLQISEEGIKALAASKTVATTLPATAFSLKEEFAPARKMIDEGCAVAVASDLNPGSCFSCSVPLLIALATIYMKMTVEEAVTALTINGAAAIGREKEVGSIEEGKLADMVLLRYPSYKFLSYHFGVNIVDTVFKGGKIVAQN